MVFQASTFNLQLSTSYPVPDIHKRAFYIYRMQQTAYTGIHNLIKKLPYLGGFCKFWFIPKEEIASMPIVNPLNQYLSADITLLAGKVWRGPVPVPDKQLGFTETQQNGKAGPSFKMQVACTYPGDLPAARVNMDNMSYEQFVVVGKLRAGGFYVVIGNQDNAMDFDQEFDSGSGMGNTISNKLAFTHEQIFRAMVLPSFNGDESGFILPGDGGGPPGVDEPEFIFIAGENTKTIAWTPTRILRFGQFPIVEVWLIDPTNDNYYLAAVQPMIDAPPPGFTLMSFDFGGPVTGFIVLK